MSKKMIKCRKCKEWVDKTNKICPSCGEKVRKPFYLKGWFVLLVLILIIIVASSISDRQEKKYDWKEIELSDRLPKPKSKVGDVWTNNQEKLGIHVDETNESDYRDYIEECQSMGYTVEGETDGNKYNAFDEEGYGLSLDYIGDTMYIELVAPQELGTLNWPKSEVANLLPLPNATVGKVSNDSSDECYIYVGETSIEDFNAYVDACADKGFTVDYDRGDKYYNAKDEQGNELSLYYKGNNVMSVEIMKSEDSEMDEITSGSETDTQENQETDSAETEVSSNGSSEIVDGMRPEFKEAMDSYEEFMNEYCDFLEKYAESDGTDVGILADYTEYMRKYTEVMEDFSAWDGEDMNDTELSYYLDVQLRINEKLAGVAGYIH